MVAVNRFLVASGHDRVGSTEATAIPPLNLNLSEKFLLVRKFSSGNTKFGAGNPRFGEKNLTAKSSVSATAFHSSKFVVLCRKMQLFVSFPNSISTQDVAAPQ